MAATARTLGSANTETAITNAWLKIHGKCGLVGYKAMPTWHSDFAGYLKKSADGFKLIAIRRLDVASCVASFESARLNGEWVRHGGPQPEKWVFRRAHSSRIAAFVRHVVASNRAIESLAGAVQVAYEQFVSPGFSSPELDEYFGHKVELADPKGPTDASRYVENFQEFSDFVSEVAAVV